MKLGKIILIWIFGVFCETVGLIYLYAHGGIMHWIAGIVIIIGTLIIGFTSYIGKELKVL